jgi:hypothetical protein
MDWPPSHHHRRSVITAPPRACICICARGEAGEGADQVREWAQLIDCFPAHALPIALSERNDPAGIKPDNQWTTQQQHSSGWRRLISAPALAFSVPLSFTSARIELFLPHFLTFIPFSQLRVAHS